MSRSSADIEGRGAGERAFQVEENLTAIGHENSDKPKEAEGLLCDQRQMQKEEKQ